MWNGCWQNELQLRLENLQGDNQQARIALIGVGNEMRGDDAVGVFLAREMQVYASCNPGFLSIECGLVPENCTGILRRFAPNLVIMIDAAQMDEAPGRIRWLDWQTTGGGILTHTLPLWTCAGFLAVELNCEVALIGIQPQNTSFGASLSPEVQEAIDEVASVLVSLLTFENQTCPPTHPDIQSNVVAANDLRRELYMWPHCSGKES